VITDYTDNIKVLLPMIVKVIILFESLFDVGITFMGQATIYKRVLSNIILGTYLINFVKYIFIS